MRKSRQVRRILGKQHNSAESGASRKGKLVESIAAQLYRSGSHVQTRVLLPPARGSGRRAREIDVLVSRSIAGNTIRYAIECKNERKPIEAPAIDAFAGKLHYLGFDTSQGIFVSRSRFTKGALERAEDAGIRLYQVTGIRDDGLTLELAKAFQSVVYLLLSTHDVSVTSSSTEATLVFVDEDSQFKGFFADLVYRMWRKGSFPTKIGFHEVSIAIPNGWFMAEMNHTEERAVKPQQPAQIFDLKVKVRIVAVVFTVEGSLQQHELVERPTGMVQKVQLNAQWKNGGTNVSLTTLTTEEALDSHLSKIEDFHLIVRRVRLPRIQTNTLWGGIYWPPSEESARKLFSLAASRVEPHPVDIEGTAFERFFDEAWDGYPGAYEE